MARRTSGADDILGGLSDLFRHTPWWVGPPVIALSYVLVAFAIPWLVQDIPGPSDAVPIGQFVGNAARFVAPWIAVLVGVVWLVSLGVKFQDDRRLNSQQGIETIRALPWGEFEQLLAEAFRRQGYTARETPTGADGGVDIVLTRGSERVLVQCKQWKQRRVGVQPVRELLGVVTSEGADQGQFVTSGSYTSEAQRFADGSRARLRLIDGPELERMIHDVQPGPRHDSPSPPTPSPVLNAAEPACPTCGAAMARRTAKRGANAGQSFWGCTTYPNCRGTRPIPCTPEHPPAGRTITFVPSFRPRVKHRWP